MVASPFGGVNIEEVAKESPSQIFKDPVDITSGTCPPQMLPVSLLRLPHEYSVHALMLHVALCPGMQREQAVNMAKKLGFSDECIDEVCRIHAL